MDDLPVANEEEVPNESARELANQEEVSKDPFSRLLFIVGSILLILSLMTGATLLTLVLSGAKRTSDSPRERPYHRPPPEQQPPSTKQIKPPNVLIIMADDLGYGDVGFNGSRDIPTPHMDSIAKHGVKFTNGYVSFPVCGPSRAGFITGRYQYRFGFATNPSHDPNDLAGLALEEETIAEALKRGSHEDGQTRAASYRTAIIGKWHLGVAENFHPLNRGFDYFYGFLEGGRKYLPEDLTLDNFTQVSGCFDWYKMKIRENWLPVNTKKYLTDELTDAAVDFITQHAQGRPSQNFMLFLSYNAPHAPYQAPAQYEKRFSHIANKKRKTYAAMVSAMDDGIGKVLQSLRDTNLEDDTLVVFLSDNGGKKPADNSPFRGTKGSLWEGGLHVPFAMKWPAGLPSNLVYTNPVISLDIMATILALNEIEPRHPLDGVNLVPYLTGIQKGKPHEYLFWGKGMFPDEGAVLHNGLKAMFLNGAEVEGAALPGQWHSYSMLYNLTQNKNEAKDLQTELNETFQSLKNAWNMQWRNEMKGSSFPSLRDNNNNCI